MLADRFTFFAQIANFLILLWLLRRFLFRPVLKAVDEREARLESRRKESEAALAAAAAEKQAWETRHAEIESARQDLLRKAEAEAGERREEMLARARADVAAEQARWERSLHEDRKLRAQAWAADIRKEAFALASKVLREVADADLSAACVKVFLRKLEALDGKELAAMQPGAGPGRELVVRTSIELGREAAAALASGLRRALRTEAPVRVGSDASLGLGIELSSGGRVLAWNISDALSELEALAESGAEAGHGAA